MTTTVRVHVNGKYRAKVKQDDKPEVIVEGNWNGGSGEKHFHLAHPATGTFVITEEAVVDEPVQASTGSNDPMVQDESRTQSQAETKPDQ